MSRRGNPLEWLAFWILVVVIAVILGLFVASIIIRSAA